MARFNNKNKKQKSPPTTTTTIPAAKNAERERGRVRCLRNAFQTLQQCLPSVPPNTKLSKLDILILATNYIQILMQILDNNNHNNHVDEKNIDEIENSLSSKVYRPIKKWPMRSRLYSTMMMMMMINDDQ
nr:transcription factor 24-like [Dermatophagoides farinae]